MKQSLCGCCNEVFTPQYDWADKICPACCDHSDIDFPVCLICGKDVSEKMAARAYDDAKDIGKYRD